MVNLLCLFLMLVSPRVFAKPDLGEAIRTLGSQSTMALTFAGVKPFSSAAPPPGYTAPSLLAEIERAQSEYRINNSNLVFFASGPGLSGVPEIQVIHKAALKRALQDPANLPFLSEMGINAQSPLETVIAKCREVADIPEPQRTAAHIAFSGVILGYPHQQIRSYLEAKRKGTSPKQDQHPPPVRKRSGRHA